MQVIIVSADDDLCLCHALLVFGDIFILPQDLQKCELACHQTFLGWGKCFLLQVLALVSFLCGGCWTDLCLQMGSLQTPSRPRRGVPSWWGAAPRCCCFPVQERSTLNLASSGGSISLSLAQGWAQVCLMNQCFFELVSCQALYLLVCA